MYSFLYENDHFNQAQAEFKKVLNGQSKQAQAEFKKVLNGQSKHAAQKKGGKRGKKKGERQGVVWDKDCPFISCIALLLQLAVFVYLGENGKLLFGETMWKPNN